MDRTTYTLAITSLLLLSACTSKDNNVGTVLTDGGSAGGAAHTGGTTTAQGGTVGGGGSGGGSSTAGCVYQGVSYAMGESFKADCNVCTCGLLGDNHVSCSLAVCLTDAGPPPSMGGGGAGGAQAGSGGYAQDAPQDSPGQVAQHPYVSNGASCINYPSTGYRGFPLDPSIQTGQGGQSWPTCTLNCNVIMATAGDGQEPLDQALPDGPCDDEGASCNSPLMAGWCGPCANTGGPGNGYTCTCRAQRWQCALASQGANMCDPPSCLTDSWANPQIGCYQATWSTTQVCTCGKCKDLCSSDGDCQSGHCNLNQVCRFPDSCKGSADCRAPCTGLCEPAASDGGQAADVANSTAPPTDQASCAKATNVPECLPGLAMATVSSAAGGPLLSNVEVTSGPCRPAACSLGCTSLTIQAPTAIAGATCDLQVTATDGRSQAVHLSAIANPAQAHVCCGNGAPPNSGGMWVILTPTVFSPNLIVVTFAADGGAP
jgi:hypothetical protein